MRVRPSLSLLGEHVLVLLLVFLFAFMFVFVFVFVCGVTSATGTFQTGDLERLFVMTSYLSLEDHDGDRTWADYEYGVDRYDLSSSGTVLPCIASPSHLFLEL